MSRLEGESIGAAGALATLKLKPQKFMLNDMIFESVPGSAEAVEAEYGIWEKSGCPGGSGRRRMAGELRE